MQALYEKYLVNVQDRVAIISAGSFFINALSGISQLAFGIFFYSPWYIINSIYYLLLCIARGRTLKQYWKARTIEDDRERYDFEFVVHKNGGIFICLVSVAYMCACLWMYFTGETRVQNEISLILAVATIAFTKIGLAIYGVIINRNMRDPIVSLFKKISFLDAMVSIVVTQCTLLVMNNVSQAVSSSALFGMAISLLFFFVGIYMIRKKKTGPRPEEYMKEKQAENTIIKFTVFDLLRLPNRKTSEDKF